jgi:GDP-L-fucose synthase
MTDLIYVAGHRGMVGSAICRRLEAAGVPRGSIVTRGREELDLTRQEPVEQFFQEVKPTQVYLAAARVGGIHANNAFPADFILQNLQVQNNVISAAFRAGVQRLLFLGSSCIYPRLAAQPMHEEALLTGHLEPTNEPYAIAKIAGIKLCESFNRQFGQSHGVDYRSVMPTNLYGPGDNYHPENSHVIPALIRRFHEAKQAGATTVRIWGTGAARREFLYVDDMADACLHVMGLPKALYDRETMPMRSHLNVGSDSDISILDLARIISEVIGFEGIIETDPSKPDGAPRKLMDSKRMHALGWSPRIEIRQGLQMAYNEFLKAQR